MNQVIFTGEGGPAQGCISLVETAEALGVFQFILVMSPPGRGGSSGALFGGVRSSSTMKQAQATLERSSLSFTIIQPGIALLVKGDQCISAAFQAIWNGFLIH